MGRGGGGARFAIRAAVARCKRTERRCTKNCVFASEILYEIFYLVRNISSLPTELKDKPTEGSD